jgi:outer membrane protein assembly factor BamB
MPRHCQLPRLRRWLTLAAWATASVGWSSPTVLSADWLEFRGSRGDGRSPVAELPKQWSEQQAIVWRSELPGEGWSSPVVLGQRIYLSAAIAASDQDDPDRELVLLILDAGTGRVLKTTPLFRQTAEWSPAIHKKNSHASPTPLIAGDRVYVHFGHQGTAATTLDGDIVWRNDALRYPPVHGGGGSPVLVGDKLIFSQDGAEKAEVLALVAATGEVAWRTPRNVEANKKFSFCTPLVLEAAGKTQVIIPGSNVVQSLEPDTGREIWRVRYDGYSVIPKPISAAGLVMVCTGYDTPSLLAIRPDGTGDVTDSHVVWTSKNSIPHTPSLLTDSGRLFMVSDRGIASCVDAATGQEIWRERIGGNFSASPLLAGKQIYLLSEEGDATVIAASDQFEVVQKNSLQARTLASMAVVDRDLLIRTDTALLRIGHP